MTKKLDIKEAVQDKLLAVLGESFSSLSDEEKLNKIRELKEFTIIEKNDKICIKYVLNG